MVNKSRRRRGFSLIELSIVLGIAFTIIAGVWTYAGSAQQTSKVQQSFDALGALVDSTRVTYAALSSITGGIKTVVPHLVLMSAVPANLLRTTATTCSGATSNIFLNSPLVTNTAVCGSLAVCDWVYGTSTACLPSDGTSSQYFAVEFDSLDYPSCVALVERVTTTLPATGLKDIYINANSGVGVLGGLPIPVDAATSVSPANRGCTQNVSTNTLDFVYELRAPST